MDALLGVFLYVKIIQIKIAYVIISAGKEDAAGEFGFSAEQIARAHFGIGKPRSGRAKVAQHAAEVKGTVGVLAIAGAPGERIGAHYLRLCGQLQSRISAPGAPGAKTTRL
jgi:hypothetical protein